MENVVLFILLGDGMLSSGEPSIDITNMPLYRIFSGLVNGITDVVTEAYSDVSQAIISLASADEEEPDPAAYENVCLPGAPNEEGLQAFTYLNEDVYQDEETQGHFYGGHIRVNQLCYITPERGACVSNIGVRPNPGGPCQPVETVTRAPEEVSLFRNSMADFFEENLNIDPNFIAVIGEFSSVFGYVAQKDYYPYCRTAVLSRLAAFRGESDMAPEEVALSFLRVMGEAGAEIRIPRERLGFATRGFLRMFGVSDNELGIQTYVSIYSRGERMQSILNDVLRDRIHDPVTPLILSLAIIESGQAGEGRDLAEFTLRMSLRDERVDEVLASNCSRGIEIDAVSTDLISSLQNWSLYEFCCWSHPEVRSLQ